LTFLLAAACSVVQTFAQTNEETRVAAAKAFEEAVALSESNKDELVPQALSKFQAAQQLYARLGEKREEANAFRGIGRSYLRLKRTDDALKAYQQALKLFEDISRKKAIALVSTEIGEIYSDLGSEQAARSAVEHFERAVSLLAEIEDKREQGRTLVNAGRAHLLSGNNQRSIELSKQALGYFQGSEDKQVRADILSNIAHAFQLAGKVLGRGEALEYFSKAIELYSELDTKESRNGKANALLNSGNGRSLVGRIEDAVRSYTQALEIYRSLNYQTEAALAWENIGDARVRGGRVQDMPQAVNAYLEAARLYHDKQEREPLKEAELLAKAGDLSFRLRQKEQALRCYEQARAIYQIFAERDPLYKPTVGRVYVTLGAIHEYLGGEKEKPLADENYRQARTIYQQLYEYFLRTNDKPSKQNRVNALRDLADVTVRLKDRDGAIETYRKAIAACKDIPDEVCEATMLTAIGSAYNNSDDAEDTRQAIAQFVAAKRLFVKNGHRDGEIWSLRSIAAAQQFLNSWQEVLQTCDDLLKVAETLPPPQADLLKAETNIWLGEAYQALENHKSAAEKLELAHALGNKLQHRGIQTDALRTLIQSYFVLGDSAKVLDRSQKLLSTLMPADHNYDLNKSLGHLMLAYAYEALGDSASANTHIQEASQTLRKVDDKDAVDVAHVLTGNSYLLGKQLEQEKSQFEEVERRLAAIRDDNAKSYALYYLSLSRAYAEDYGRALEYAQQGLALTRKTKNSNFAAVMLLMVGYINWEKDHNQEAITAFQRAAAIFEAHDARLFEVYALAGLMVAWRDADNPRLAIFYGKQGIKIIQELRGQNKSLDNELQKSYVKRIEDLYVDLTELLLSEGRPDEAQQVINLARDQSFFDLGGQNQPSAEIQLTQREMENSAAWHKALAKAGVALRESQRPEAVPARAGKQQSGVGRTEDNAEYLSALRRIAEDFKQPPGDKDKLASVTDTERVQAILRDLNSANTRKAAILYTFIGDDSFYVLLNTLDDKVELFESPVKSDELNGKLLQFYALLQSKVYDPRVLGKELYDIIIPKRLEARLRSEGVEVLVWSLDRSLRYIPMAALSPDGQHYLVERYGNVAMTRVEPEKLTKKGSPDWTGYGFFTSGPRTVKVYENTVNFTPLDKDEAQIFRTRTHPEGIIAGETYSEFEFTKAALLGIQKQRRPVIHISSHFRFYPGNPDLSFLLLGDGQILPLSELKKHANIFQGVELLTLSACDTAAQFPDADGKEIDGFAELAQRLGAGSVMASLWPVTDTSTTQLMKGFYTHRQSGKLNKADALRQAQLDLINEGRAAAARGASASRESKITKGNVARDDIVVEDRYRVEFPNGQGFAHPYYWSPFVLFGNWK
jgi:CHAT domain-containing protein/predicted negative regulator of RcsB-dependent stress response